jgi:hypothetical protein
MQEENPETEVRGRELPGGGAVFEVDNGCSRWRSFFFSPLLCCAVFFFVFRSLCQ